jgi:hypothetical protein
LGFIQTKASDRSQLQFIAFAAQIAIAKPVYTGILNDRPPAPNVI